MSRRRCESLTTVLLPIPSGSFQTAKSWTTGVGHRSSSLCRPFFFFLKDPAPPDISPLPPPAALPICPAVHSFPAAVAEPHPGQEGALVLDGLGPDVIGQPLRVAALAEAEIAQPEARQDPGGDADGCRSEEHTSELQSQSNLVCRLLLE